MLMQKITIYLALLFLLVAPRVSAQQPEAMQVYNTSGLVQSVSLVSIQHITFENVDGIGFLPKWQSFVALYP